MVPFILSVKKFIFYNIYRLFFQLFNFNILTVKIEFAYIETKTAHKKKKTQVKLIWFGWIFVPKSMFEQALVAVKWERAAQTRSSISHGSALPPAHGFRTCPEVEPSQICINFLLLLIFSPFFPYTCSLCV